MERLDIIINELCDMRKEITSGFLDQAQRIRAVEVSLAPLVGNGQPGRVTKLEDEVDDLQKASARQLGWLAGATVMFNLAWHFLAYKLPAWLSFVH